MTFARESSLCRTRSNKTPTSHFGAAAESAVSQREMNDAVGGSGPPSANIVVALKSWWIRLVGRRFIGTEIERAPAPTRELKGPMVYGGLGPALPAEYPSQAYRVEATPETVREWLLRTRDSTKEQTA